MPSPADKPKRPARGTYPQETKAPRKGRKRPPEGLGGGGSSGGPAKTNVAPVSGPGHPILRPIPRPRKPAAKGTRRKAPKVPDERWGLVRVKVGQERYAKFNIERQGMTAFYPRIIDKPGRPTALFPGYMFVLIEDRWHFLRSTYGVVGIVPGTGGEPARVPPKLMRQLKRDQGKLGYIDARPPLPPKPKPLKPGDPVMVTDGTFKTLRAEYISPRPGDRVRVLLEFMGKAQRVDLPADAVRIDHDAPSKPGPTKAKPGAVARKQSGKRKGHQSNHSA